MAGSDPAALIIMNIIKQKIRYDNAAIVQQATLYTDYYRVIAEYVDNSIDSAEIFYKDIGYCKNIEISIAISGKRQEDFKITIKDNCRGMEINPSEPYTIFRSNKICDPSTNGMFGFGMFSFFSICNRMQVSTLKKDSNTRCNFEITSETFSIPEGTDPSLELNLIQESLNQPPGTIITLADFHEGVSGDISAEQLKHEIEKHFELVLSRKNISISIIDPVGEIKFCKPFNYEKYCKTPFTKSLNELQRTYSKKNKTKKKFNISISPVRIYLISSFDTEFNREPFFSFKGRRVVEVSKVDQFRSNKKFQIWSRSNVTGYIDITNVLFPTPNRRDFKSSEISKAFFQTLLILEDEILKYLETNVRIDNSKKLKKLENKFNTAIREFIYEMYSNEKDSGKETGSRVYRFKGYKYRKESEKLSSDITSGKRTTGIRSQSEKERNINYEIKLPDPETGICTETNNLEIKIDSANEPHTDIKGNQLRSVISGNTVFIFEKHSDLQKRLQKSLKDYTKIKDNILYYVAMEFMTHFVERSKTESPTSHIEFVTLVLELEDKLKTLQLD